MHELHDVISIVVFNNYHNNNHSSFVYNNGLHEMMSLVNVMAELTTRVDSTITNGNSNVT